MKIKQWLVISKNGINKIRKEKPCLSWNEIAIQISLDIPDALFVRPHLEATITVQDIPNTTLNPEVIINTKELIEQQTGAKIDFRVIHDEEQK